MSDAFQLLNPPQPITCFAYNKDRTKLAISPNNNEVHVYSKSGSGWTRDHLLQEHDKLVTGLDWSAETDRIVSCSQDRNAYVWTLTDGAWKPTLVILRINRAATQVKWSPKGDKFAVSSGARCISVCYFEEDNDWWVSKHIKKPIRSTVLSIDWHPNNVLIAAGCADFKARVFSGYIKGLDKKPEPTAWGVKMPFGELMGEFKNDGWVHDVKFSPDGNSIAYVGHNSSFAVVNGEDREVHLTNTKNLPFRCIQWINSTKILAAGHELNPTVFAVDGSKNWNQEKQIDTGAKKKEATGNSAFNKFRQMDSRAQESAEVGLNTQHQNAINGIAVHTGSREAIAKVTTFSVDGMMITWTL